MYEYVESIDCFMNKIGDYILVVTNRQILY